MFRQFDRIRSRREVVPALHQSRAVEVRRKLVAQEYGRHVMAQAIPYARINTFMTVSDQPRPWPN
jgi:hypothetical protein